MISIITAFFLFLAVRVVSWCVRSKAWSGYMQRYASAPEDARGHHLSPTPKVTELREAEEALQELQTDLTQALKQRERLAQLGGAVAKVSHDLRNILTSAQLFTDRIEASDDPLVRRMAPKLVNSITRAVSLCESTLAFGRAEEPAPTLTMVRVRNVAEDVVASEQLAVADACVEIVNDVPEDLVVRADPEQLFRVIMNLVRNARQAIWSPQANPGAYHHCHRLRTGTEWCIEISDTAPACRQKAARICSRRFRAACARAARVLGLPFHRNWCAGMAEICVLKETGPTEHL